MYKCAIMVEPMDIKSLVDLYQRVDRLFINQIIRWNEFRNSYASRIINLIER